MKRFVKGGKKLLNPNGKARIGAPGDPCCCYRQARKCSDGTLADVWVSDGLSGTFKTAPDSGCYYVDSADAPAGLGGTPYEFPLLGCSCTDGTCSCCQAAINGVATADGVTHYASQVTLSGIANPDICDDELTSLGPVDSGGNWGFQDTYYFDTMISGTGGLANYGIPNPYPTSYSWQSELTLPVALVKRIGERFGLLGSVGCNATTKVVVNRDAIVTVGPVLRCSGTVKRTTLSVQITGGMLIFYAAQDVDLDCTVDTYTFTLSNATPVNEFLGHPWAPGGTATVTLTKIPCNTRCRTIYQSTSTNGSDWTDPVVVSTTCDTGPVYPWGFVQADCVTKTIYLQCAVADNTSTCSVDGDCSAVAAPAKPSSDDWSTNICDYCVCEKCVLRVRAAFTRKANGDIDPYLTTKSIIGRTCGGTIAYANWTFIDCNTAEIDVIGKPCSADSDCDSATVGDLEAAGLLPPTPFGQCVQAVNITYYVSDGCVPHWSVTSLPGCNPGPYPNQWFLGRCSAGSITLTIFIAYACGGCIGSGTRNVAIGCPAFSLPAEPTSAEISAALVAAGCTAWVPGCCPPSYNWSFFDTCGESDSGIVTLQPDGSYTGTGGHLTVTLVKISGTWHAQISGFTCTDPGAGCDDIAGGSGTCPDDPSDAGYEFSCDGGNASLDISRP